MHLTANLVSQMHTTELLFSLDNCPNIFTKQGPVIFFLLVFLLQFLLLLSLEAAKTSMNIIIHYLHILLTVYLNKALSAYAIKA